MSRPSAPVAILTSQERAAWSDPTLQVGQPLCEGQTVTLERGQAQISIGCGAEILARGPCSLTLLASDRVRLCEGEIVVDVAPWARGFTVVTDNMDIVDLGTKFAVSASSDATAETTVLQGLVRARPTKTHEGQQRSVLLSEGERLFVDELGNRRSDRHVSAEVLGVLDASLPAPYRPVTLHNSGIGIAEGDPDPNWRVISGPEGAFQEPEFAQVCVPHERYLANDPAESQWISMKDWATASPNSIYTFRTTFRLTGYDLSTMRLFGRFLADNGVAEVRVNGRAVAVESWTDQLLGQRFDAPQFRFVNVTDGLVDGENVIEIDVWNGTVNHGPETRVVMPNHMALRAEWYAFGRPSYEEYEGGTETAPRRRHAVIGR